MTLRKKDINKISKMNSKASEKEIMYHKYRIVIYRSYLMVLLDVIFQNKIQTKTKAVKL